MRTSNDNYAIAPVLPLPRRKFKSENFPDCTEFPILDVNPGDIVKFRNIPEVAKQLEKFRFLVLDYVYFNDPNGYTVQPNDPKVETGFVKLLRLTVESQDGRLSQATYDERLINGQFASWFKKIKGERIERYDITQKEYFDLLEAGEDPEKGLKLLDVTVDGQPIINDYTDNYVTKQQSFTLDDVVYVPDEYIVVDITDNTSVDETAYQHLCMRK